MKKMRLGFGGLLAVVLATAVSCSSSSDPNRKETFPVRGEVYVDGKPAANLKVELHNVAGMDQAQPTMSTTYTTDDGTFSLSTYQANDGVPEGEYSVTFFWGELNVFNMQYGGPDKLKGKYSDPKKTPFKLTVQKGQPNDLGKIELTTN